MGKYNQRLRIEPLIFVVLLKMKNDERELQSCAREEEKADIFDCATGAYRAFLGEHLF
jgi:hypothetical protein